MGAIAGVFGTRAVNVQVGAPALQQGIGTAALQLILNLRCRSRLVHTEDLAGFPPQKFEARHGGTDTKEDLALNRWGRRRQARVKILQREMPAAHQSGEKRHSAIFYRKLHLRARQPVDLDQDESRLVSFTCGRLDAKQAREPMGAAKFLPQPSQAITDVANQGDF